MYMYILFYSNYINILRKNLNVYINGLKDNVKLFGSTINAMCVPL
jgi:hypothetical protein